MLQTKNTHPIKFHCPHCGTSLQAKTEVGGKQRNCPKCRRRFQVPASSEKEPGSAKEQGFQRELREYRSRELRGL